MARALFKWLEKCLLQAPLDDYCYRYADKNCQHALGGSCDPVGCSALTNRCSESRHDYHPVSNGAADSSEQEL